jgi:hypothetical protein
VRFAFAFLVVLGCSGPIERLEATSLDRLGHGFEPARRGDLEVAGSKLRVEASRHQASVRRWRPPSGSRRPPEREVYYHAVWLLDATGAVVDHKLLAPGCDCGGEVPDDSEACRWWWWTLPDRDRVVEVVVTEEAGDVWLAMPTGPIVARVTLARIHPS